MKNRDYLFRYRTPESFNNLLLRSDGKQLTGLWFEGGRNHMTGESCGKVETGLVSGCEASIFPVMRDTCRWLDIYFSGSQPDFTPDYSLEALTSFRKEVLREVCKIPFGKTATYGEIAERIAKRHGEKKMSAQAVGGAVGWNPICLIIPCHRVIGANGNLTGYSGGIHNKIALIRLEGVI